MGIIQRLHLLRGKTQEINTQCRRQVCVELKSVSEEENACLLES